MTPSSSDIARPSDTLRRSGTLAVCLGTLAIPMDSSVNVAFPAIIAAFHLPIADIQWIVICYTLTYAALMLVCGRAGDILGHRLIFLSGCAVSAIALLLCAFARTYPLLLTARVLQGVGAALTLSCGPALLTALHSEARRVAALGLYTLVFGLGSTLGPLLGGVLVPLGDWPAVFAFRTPIALAALALGWCLPSDTPQGAGRFDLTGAILLVGTVASLMLALDQLQHATSLPISAATFILVATLAIAFVLRQRRTAHPLIDLTHFRDADFILLNIGNAALNMAAFAVLLLVPFYLAQIAQVSRPVLGIIIAASPFGAMIAAPIATRLTKSIRAKPLALLGAGAVVAGALLILAGTATSCLALITIAALLQGFGVGLFQVAYFDIATATLPIQHRGVAGSLVMMTRTMGLVIGATMLTLTFQRVSTGASQRGLDDTTAFLTGFDAAFMLATALALVIVVWAMMVGWARRPAAES